MSMYYKCVKIYGEDRLYKIEIISFNSKNKLNCGSQYSTSPIESTLDRIIKCFIFKSMV